MQSLLSDRAQSGWRAFKMSLGRSLGVSGNPASRDVHMGETWSVDWNESPSWTPLKTELLQAVVAASLKSDLLPGSAWKSGHRFPSYQSELFHEYQIHFKKIRFNKTISVGEAAVLGERLKYGFALNSLFCQMIGMPQKYYCKHFKNKTQSSRLI